MHTQLEGISCYISGTSGPTEGLQNILEK